MPETSTESRANDEQRWALLMVAAQGGGEGEYRQLLTELGEVIHAFLCSRFGRQHFIEDCVQDTLIAIHQARHTYDARRPFRPWLFAIVRHKAIDSLRRQRSQRELLALRRQEALAQGDASESNQAETELAQGQLLASLSSQHREVITLTRIHGLSTAETATQLQISESAVKLRVHRATRRLRQMLEADAL